VKFIFFLTVLINITFFLWEYRKGAPEVYLPQRLEHSQADAQNIILLSNPPEIPGNHPAHFFDFHHGSVF
jgi:hypothetical protein